MRASAAGKIADPSSAASLENNWIVSAIGWTTICKRSLQATWRFCRRGKEEILETRRLEGKWKVDLFPLDSNESCLC